MELPSFDPPAILKQKSIAVVVPEDVDKFLNEHFNVDPNQSMNSDEEEEPTNASQGNLSSNFSRMRNKKSLREIP